MEVFRRATAPVSLARKNSYKNKDVLDALFEDFFKKCYLCEQRIGGLTGKQVDHRIPVAVDSNLKFEWKNLFPCCGPSDGCNQRRPDYPSAPSYPGKALLDPSLDPPEIMSRLVQSFQVIPEVKAIFVEKYPGDIVAQNTAEELRHIHDAHTLMGRAIVDAVHQQVTYILILYSQLSTVTDPAEMALLQRKLKEELSRQAPFSTLVRSSVPNLSAYFPD